MTLTSTPQAIDAVAAAAASAAAAGEPTAGARHRYALHLGANALVLCLVAIPVGLFAQRYLSFGGLSLAWVWSVRYRDIALQQFLPCEDKRPVAAVRQYDRYWLFEHYAPAARTQRTPCGGAVTYCTHGRDLTFFAHLPALAASWRGPISAALYAPGTDLDDMLAAIRHVRRCLLQSALVRDWVSFHLVVPHAHLPPSLPTLPYRDEPDDGPYDCNQTAPYERWDYRQAYAYRHRLAYPVNVLRNVARQLGNTHFFLSADVHQLAGSIGAWDNFLESIYGAVCPVYTLENDEQMPYCRHLHAKNLIMHKLHMITADEVDVRLMYEVLGFRLHNDTVFPATLAEFLLTHQERRAHVVHDVDPNFIGDPTTPYHDERFNWQADNPRHRHMQTYAMCLLNIRMGRLSDLFLVFSVDKEQRVYPNASALTADAAHLTNGQLQHEYANLYGGARKEACRLCFYRRKVCF